MAQILRGLSWMSPVEEGVAFLESHREAIENLIALLHEGQEVSEPAREETEEQLTLSAVK